MIRSGSENVHAAEVEAAILAHPGVSAAAVVGLPDAALGELVACLLKLEPGWEWETGTEGTATQMMCRRDSVLHADHRHEGHLRPIVLVGIMHHAKSTP